MADFGWLWKRNKNTSGESAAHWRERLCFIRKGNLGYMSEKTGKPELVCHLVDLHAVSRASFPEAGHENAFILEFQPQVRFLPSGEKVEVPVEHICLSADEEAEASRWMRDIILSYTDIRAQRIFVRSSYPAAKQANPLMTKAQITKLLQHQYTELSAEARKRYAGQVQRVASPLTRSRSRSRSRPPPDGSGACSNHLMLRDPDLESPLSTSFIRQPRPLGPSCAPDTRFPLLCSR